MEKIIREYKIKKNLIISVPKMNGRVVLYLTAYISSALFKVH